MVALFRPSGIRIAAAQTSLAHFVLCAPVAIPVTDDQMNGDLAVVQARLNSGFGIADAQVTRSGGRCIDVDMPASDSQDSIIGIISKTGYLALADSDSQYLKPGTKVKLRCKQKDCAPHARVGRTSIHAKPPILQIVVPQQDVQQGSAQVGTDETGAPMVTYAIQGEGSDAWCAYTTSHIDGYAAIVVDNKILSDPQIAEPVCGSNQTQITGLPDTFEAQKIATYLNYGPLAVALDLIDLT